MDLHWTRLAAAGLFVFLIWMDACLYAAIQSWPNSNQANDSVNLQIINAMNRGNETSDQAPWDNPAIFSLANFMDKFSFAFHGMSIKLIMTDPVDNYLLAPLADSFANLLKMKDNFLIVSPNMISYSGVVSSLIAAKLVSDDCPTSHKLSYLFFQLRTWLDDLDGSVARLRLGIMSHVSLKSTEGYFVDGICDAIGFLAYIIGCYVFMRKSLRRNQKGGKSHGRRYELESITELRPSANRNSSATYIPLDGHLARDLKLGSDQEEEFESDASDQFAKLSTTSQQHLIRSQDVELTRSRQNYPRQSAAYSKVYLRRKYLRNGNNSSVIFYRYIRERLRGEWSERGILLLALYFTLQLAISATFWNRYILVYRDLLETQPSSSTGVQLQAKLIKSNMLYLIVWFWRLTNGHSLMQMLAASVLLGKLWEFLNCIKYIGFIEIILLAFFTELHIIDVRDLLQY